MARWLSGLCVGTGLMLAACKIPTGGPGGGGGGGGGGVASVTVSPATACLAAGQKVQLTATMKDNAGNVLVGPAVTWASSNAAVATVDGSGLVTGVATGSATITATSQAHSGTAGIALQSGIATATLWRVRGRLAVGDSGAMLRYDGTRWSPLCSGTTSALHAIIRNYLGVLFVAGAQGTILQFDTIGGWWTFQPSGTTSTLYDLARAPGAIFGTLVAVGAGGTILGYDGTSWSVQSSGTTRQLFGVGKVPLLGADIAVGAGGTILRYNGTSWSAEASGTTSDLYYVSVLDSANAYAIGAGGTIVHYDGTHWGPIQSGRTVTLRAADVAVDTTTGAVTGYFGVGDGGTILHSSDGVTWNPQPSGTTNDLFSVTVASASDAFAVGASGIILHYDGTTWSKQR